jgi:isoaspartyl peptidase/L-asparaginase-like protein (Ntn-hydrolase superfamily)
MSDYTKTTNFATKDSLTSGDPAKIVKGTEINTEFNNIQTAVNSKSNSASPAFTGTMTAVTVNVSGTLTAGTITGGTF